MAQLPSLKSRKWERFLSAPDPQLLTELYVPALSMAVKYDRCCAYFSSSSLQAAAAGFGKFIATLEALGEKAPKPAIRLFVNEELSPEDVKALTEKGDVGPLERHLGKSFKTPTEALQKKRLAMLGWLVKRGLLEVKVGVMRSAGGIMHAKYGLIYDTKGNALVFSGSGNESASGMLSNYEEIEIAPSWTDTAKRDYFEGRFDQLWEGTNPNIVTVPLPQALTEKLIKMAPKEAPVEEPTDDAARQKAAMMWQWMAEAPYMEFGGEVCDTTATVQMWPHQRNVVKETSDAWPDGRLLCDEVGMGKTLEAILVLRRLLAGRGVKRGLILVPAGLVKQWQAELREKGGIIVPRLEGEDLVWPDGREDKNLGLAKAIQLPLLLMSREKARTSNNLQMLCSTEPWDIVVVDEAHAARRASNNQSEFNSPNLLLGMIRDLELRGQAKSILLLSATPMQTSAWEPWDLIQPLGEGGPWIAEFDDIHDFYQAIVDTESGQITQELADLAASMVELDPDFPTNAEHPEWKTKAALAQQMVFGSDETRLKISKWLRKGSPLSRRLHRNTRTTLRHYFDLGLIPSPPAKRNVVDCVWDFDDDRERKVYRAVETYIDQRFKAMEEEKKGKGFLMTVYRRRAASSLAALHSSLSRRLELVEKYLSNQFSDDPTRLDLPEDFNTADLPEDYDRELPNSAPSSIDEATKERSQLQTFIRDLDDLGGQDSKLARFVGILETITADGRPCLVFSEYSDTMKYLRDQLSIRFSGSGGLATYSGDGGSWFDGNTWHQITKDEVARRLRQGQLQLILCTDAASEGLNLQAASALVNYDLPFNPSKVEQRIGRIDRIGQQQPSIHIVNMFLAHSVDEIVYSSLRTRCGMFEHFVGSMQPVLSLAKKLLLDNSKDIAALEKQVEATNRDVLSRESYPESDAVLIEAPTPRLTTADLQNAIRLLGGVKGASVSFSKDHKACTLAVPGSKRLKIGLTLDALERDSALLPLNPCDPTMRQVADALTKTLQGLPLVIASCERGSFRASTAVWVGRDGNTVIANAAHLYDLLEAWDGTKIDSASRHLALKEAVKESEARVATMEQAVAERVRASKERQTLAAQYRLSLAICKTLAAQNNSASLTGIHKRMYDLMNRGGSAGEILKQALSRLGSYPSLPSHHGGRVTAYIEKLTKSKQDAAATLTMVDAAMKDPRWQVK